PHGAPHVCVGAALRGVAAVRGDTARPSESVFGNRGGNRCSDAPGGRSRSGVGAVGKGRGSGRPSGTPPLSTAGRNWRMPSGTPYIQYVWCLPRSGPETTEPSRGKGALVTTRIVHRPARTVHPPAQRETRDVEAPPTLPEGNAQGNPLLALLPMVGMMASLTIMMVLRNPAFMALGAVVLVVALLGGAVMIFSRRGQAARQRRTQRER